MKKWIPDYHYCEGVYGKGCPFYNVIWYDASIHDLESVVAKLQGDLQGTNNSINTANSGGVITISDDVRFNRLDVLEEKQRKTQKLVKLGISLLLGGI